MDTRPAEKATEDERELVEASRIRRDRDLALSMSERLEKLARLAKQMSAVKGTARFR